MPRQWKLQTQLLKVISTHLWIRNDPYYWATYKFFMHKMDQTKWFFSCQIWNILLDINNQNRNLVSLQTSHSYPSGTILGQSRFQQLYCLVWPRTLHTVPAGSGMSHICKLLFVSLNKFLPSTSAPSRSMPSKELHTHTLLIPESDSGSSIIATTPCHSPHSETDSGRSHNGVHSCLFWLRTFTLNYPSSFM